MCPAVRIDEGEDGSGRLANPEIACRTRTGLTFAEELDSQMAGGDMLGKRGRAVVDHQNLEQPPVEALRFELATQVPASRAG
jgi:hypothetical protein